PAFGSPAVDAFPGEPCTTVPTDQRHVARPQGASCDAGAVEVAPGELTGLDCGPPHNLVPGAQLQHCDLSAEDLAGVDLTGASILGADLSFATGVDTVVGLESTLASSWRG